MKKFTVAMCAAETGVHLLDRCRPLLDKKVWLLAERAVAEDPLFLPNSPSCELDLFALSADMSQEAIRSVIAKRGLEVPHRSDVLRFLLEYPRTAIEYQQSIVFPHVPLVTPSGLVTLGLFGRKRKRELVVKYELVPQAYFHCVRGTLVMARVPLSVR